MKVACVEYLNALPFTDALEALYKDNQLEYVKAVPSACARMLKTGEVDIALLPIGALVDFEKLHLVSEYCISCIGPVRTVKLFSNQAIEVIDTIALDPSSRTSNILVKILLRDFWKRDKVKLVMESDSKKDESMASLKIGDAAFQLEGLYAYEYDLGEIWYEMTRLPFVFAVWVSIKPTNQVQQNILNQAFNKSVTAIDQLIQTKKDYDKEILESYFKENIHYGLDELKKRGMQHFIELSGIPNILIA